MAVASGVAVPGGTCTISGGKINCSSSNTALQLQQGSARSDGSSGSYGQIDSTGGTINKTGTGNIIDSDYDSGWRIKLVGTTISALSSNSVSGKVCIVDVPTNKTYYSVNVFGLSSSATAVCFPSWTAKEVSGNAQDDIIWGWGTKTTTYNATNWYYKVYKSKHNSESGTYYTHVYYGNGSTTTSTALLSVKVTL